MPAGPLLVMLVLIIWLRSCVIFSLYILLPFVNNENFVGKLRSTAWKRFLYSPFIPFYPHGLWVCFIKWVITHYYHDFDVQIISNLVSRSPLKLTPVSFQYVLVIFWEHNLTFWHKKFVRGSSFTFPNPSLESAISSRRLGFSQVRNRI